MFVHNTEHVCVWQILTPRYQTKKKRQTQIIYCFVLFSPVTNLYKKKRISKENNQFIRN